MSTKTPETAQQETLHCEPGVQTAALKGSALSTLTCLEEKAAEELELLESEAEQETKKRFKSAGHRIHNEITYRGVDWLLNSTVGVAMTYWSARTPSGRKHFQQPVTNFFRAALKPLLKTEAALNEGARWGSMFTSIIVGGTIILMPMVLLEDKKNKKAIVTKGNHIVHGKEKVENDPRFAEELRGIDDEPHKNFTTGMLARLAVLAPMIGVTLLPGANEKMVKYLYNPIGRGSKWLAESMGIRPRNLMARGEMEIADGGIKDAPKFVSDWDFIHRTIGFDLGLTFIYSFAHEWAYKGLAALGFKKTEEEERAAATAGAPQPVQPGEAATPSEQARHAPGHRTPGTETSVREFLRKPELAVAEVSA